MKLIECPRDAIQGIDHFIPTANKIEYLNELIEAGFDTIDFGSFVSPKAVPQMADTAEVLKGLNLGERKTKLLAIVANERGAEEALQYEEITYLGYPFSVSETFQRRNTNAGIAESMERVKAIQDLCSRKNRELVIYISMGFGNPYGDDWNAEIALSWVDKLRKFGIRTFSLADTIGVADPEIISYLFGNLIPAYPDLEFGAHLHSRPDNWREKIQAAWEAGCRRFDGAIMGYGGCPFAADELVGNIATENLIVFFREEGIATIEPERLTRLQQSFQKLVATVLT